MAKCVPEQLADLIFALLPDGTATAFGRRETEVNAGFPRVVAVPLGAPEIAEAKMPGGQASTPPGRQLYVRMFSFEWECHGATFELAENLFLETLKAVRKITHAAVQFSDEEWVDQQPQADGWEKNGNVIKFKSLVQMPIYEQSGGRTTLTADPPIVTTVTIDG